MYYIQWKVLNWKGSWDAYDIKGVECERSFIKKAYLSVLFSETKDQAVMSVLNSANKLGLTEGYAN